MRIKGTTAVVTGASAGIGRAIALRLAEKGASVWAVARSKDELQTLATENSKITPFVADLTILAQRQALVDAVGSADILVNNAGFGVYRDTATITEAQYRKMFELNVFAPLDLSQKFLPAMKELGGGHIVNMGSLAGYVSFAPITHYSMTKHAIRAFSTGLRSEGRPYNITVALITPGPVDTGFRTKAQLADDKADVYDGHGVSANAVAKAVTKSIRRRKIPGYQTIAVPRIGGVARLAILPFGERAANFVGGTYVVPDDVS